MSAIKDGRYPIMLDKERHLLFNLNVLDELQERAGGYDKLPDFIGGESGTNIKNLKWLLTLLINEGAEDGEELTEKQVGRIINVQNLQNVMDCIYKAFSKGNTGDEEISPSEDDEKNVKSGRKAK